MWDSKVYALHFLWNEGAKLTLLGCYFAILETMHYYVTFSIFHHPYHMQVLKYYIDDFNVSFFFNMIARRIRTEPVTLIETDFLKKLLDYCTNQPDSGVGIRGPSGTGKSSSALYLWYKLRRLETPVPFLACSPQCNHVFKPYLKSFCKGNYSLHYVSAIL